MAEEKAPEQAPESGEKKKESPGNNKMLFWGIIGGIIVLQLVISWITISLMRPRAPEEVLAEQRADSLKTVMAEKTTMGAVLEEPIEAIVNIAGTNGERFLKVVLVLEYDDEEYPDLGMEILRRKPRLKNQLIDLLSQKEMVELVDPRAKDEIRQRYREVVNNTLPQETGKIQGVYFDQFIIQ